MLAIGVSGATAFILALICGLLIFLYVRIYGEDELRRGYATRAGRRLP
jgi:hypothetical protein